MEPIIEKDINVWYITGCTSGVGLGLVEKLLKNPKNRVTGTSRDLKKIESLAISSNPNFLGIQVDILNEENVKESVERTIKHFGDLTHVVNNAGYGIVGAVEEGSAKEYQDLFETLYFYPLRVIRSVLPHMRSKKNGYIFNISSVAGFNAHGFFGAYSGAKFAMVGTSQSLADDVKPFNIKVACVILGYFKTNFQTNMVTDAGFVKNLIPEYNTKQIWNQFITPMLEKLVPGDVNKFADLIVDHYAVQPQLPYNLFIGPKDGAFDPSYLKIKELEQQLDSQVELNSNVVLN
ncbi:hypothetical protein DICPUDRAFT_92875 [Dictyostelium purpureum]|uniref:Uncharacterized protein n=1 Tax=Dictyostelium purpureum TaxID=5786 RepID=F0ZYG8_DICPU|nr:uncharacterized protein DICPUDRAFT_92875 [Dictyostelium purpureum]EGC31019.1 hypothetical protein DICPUDRAFT_92875 [Dictyostelium purpureum]|eukprot:XP_003292457.1 hypothetical protein DICPUDRAFT_92875 [Dictyostelium purpureum]